MGQFFEDGRCELYDIEADLSEQNNIAAQHPEKTAELRALLHNWQRESGARFPEPNPDWQ